MTNGTAPPGSTHGSAETTPGGGRLARSTVGSGNTTHPVDIALMRETVEILLAPDAAPGMLPPPADELATLTETVRRHLELLIPEVEQAAGKLGKDSIPRYCALACVGEARGKLRTDPSPRFGGNVGHAQRLARVLNALCDHYVKIGSDHS
ncbi:DUF6415 family natural product biosynthesis protein [Streptomyces sp. NPDC051677]|uniref:DUF6415 family natural product biosynthesis protein n=1 Tax=Streptomyces sp. NPDC051677 TaxID=3365669 RepID=UPI0037CD520F